MLAPFGVRSFRFQFPADMATSWGIEMENLVLGWYILVETGSVFALTLFWALLYLGTLLAPIFGMMGDRFGHRRVLCAMRAAYAVLGTTVTILAFAGLLRPAFVMIVATLSGLIRPSDMGMRNALVAATMPTETLMATMGVSRTTQDSARIAGSLAGAGLFATFGLGPVYAVIATCYAIGFLLTLGVASGRVPLAEGAVRASVWRDLCEGLSYVWDSPGSLAALWLAFLVNLTAFPLTSGLLPYVAREVYRIDETGLGTLIASFAIGSLFGSIVVSVAGRSLRPARMMIMFALAWYGALLVFAQMQNPISGRMALVIAGFTQSLSLVPMSVMLLHSAGERFRGRVMGVRMLAIYGVPIGLLVAGALIERIGFVATTSLYCFIGALLTLFIAVHWRDALWPVDAPANAR
ncbi:MAG: MFS transporter [Alphaproteobacteria bacterium]|nr:MFS transporter [Alphaproteobacteria bacterium]